MLFHCNSNLTEISFCPRHDSNDMIATKFCTCAETCCSSMATKWITARRSFHRIWITNKKYLWKGPLVILQTFTCFKICSSGIQHKLHFYTPVWKTGRIMPWQCPSVRLSVRLSVRPSVRPRFPDFSSTCFEISIWNLVYTFSRWHDMSSLSCITIGSLWPSLQPKVGQTYFLQSWPHK